MNDALVPHIAGPWQPLFRPTKHSAYVNDHTVFLGHDGRWHLFGCTRPVAQANPEMERYLCHARGEPGAPLDAEMQECGPVIDHGTRAWAPGGIRVGHRHFLYYGPSPTRMAHSLDCNHWMGAEIRMVGTPLDAAHRDHMIVQLNKTTWLMYAVGIDAEGMGCVSVHVSNDMREWRFVQYALTTAGDAPLRPAWGAIESPYVIRVGDHWYLFITYTDCRRENYQDTLVFRSHSPYDFGEYRGSDDVVIARLQTHAAEILLDPGSGKWWITNAGWPGYGIPIEGGVAIAPLQWANPGATNAT
jgi:beta-fructofuranosidase